MQGNALIHNNSSKNRGGGLYLTSGTSTISGNAKIYSNIANTEGGGVYIASGGFLQTGGGGWPDVRISNNIAGDWPWKNPNAVGNWASPDSVTNGRGGGIYMVDPRTDSTDATDAQIPSSGGEANIAYTGAAYYVVP